MSFLTLHILNFTSTLSPSSFARNNAQSSTDSFIDYSTKVDITSPEVANVLKSLAVLHPTEINLTSNILVDVAPPVYILIVPPGSRSRNYFKPSERIDEFMTAWSKLVGDPLLSKWIVLGLACSLLLNGYLLKGIAEGAIRGFQPPTVRFLPVAGASTGDSDDKRVPETRLSTSRSRPSFSISDEPNHLNEAARTGTSFASRSPDMERIAAPVAVHPNEANGVSAFLLDMKLRSAPSVIKGEEPNEALHVRSLEECIRIYDNGPRPVEAALATLNDEELILLAQNGKIAPYALEKVLGDLQRAVVIRRALICTSNE